MQRSGASESFLTRERSRSASKLGRPPDTLNDLLNARSRELLKAKLEIEYRTRLRGIEALYTHPEEFDILAPSGRVYRDTSIFCLLPGHEPRRSAIMFVESRYFDPFILVTILCNCVTMAWESPLDQPGTWKSGIIGMTEWIFLSIFTMELAVKVLAYGFLMHRGSYLRDAWCQLDFVVVTLAWLPILFPSFGNYSVLRALRALRPLRALKRVPGMPVLVQWLLDVLPKMVNVLLLFAFVFLVFGIAGMELFKGSLHFRCALPGFVEGSSAAQQVAYDTQVVCHQEQDHPGRCPDDLPVGTECSFFNANPNFGTTAFDSVALTFIVLAQGTTFDDWAEPMYQLMVAFSPHVWVYFVLIVLIGGFFVVNLFLAVIFLEYAASKNRVDAANSIEKVKAIGAEDTAALLAGHEISDVQVKEEASSCCDCPPPERGARRLLATIARSSWLGVVTTSIVVVNIIIMCMPYEGMPTEYADRLEDTATMISVLFILEMGIKVVGLGCSGYWSDGWNVSSPCSIRFPNPSR